MARKKSDRLYVIKTAPNRERNVVDLINKYYMCQENEEYGDVVVLRQEEEIEKEGKVGRVWKRQIPQEERKKMKEEREKKIASEKGLETSEVDVELSEIPTHRERRKSALGLFGLKLKRKKIDVDRRICLVDEIVVPQLRGYVVISTKDRKLATDVVRRIRFAWKVLDGTVSRRELELNIKDLEERTRLDVGDIVIPQSGTLKGEKAEVIGVTFDGRLKVRTITGSVPIDFTISKDKLVKAGADEE